MSTKKDIEFEISRFEEEITKLNPNVKISDQAISSSTYVISAPPVPSITIKPRINIVIPSGSTSNFAFNYQNTSYLNPGYSISSTAAQLPYQLPKSSTKSFNSDTPIPTALKRDSSGNIIGGTKSVPTTAAAAATAVAAAAAADSDAAKKDKKNKDNKDKKKKKLIRSAGGQTWEDETLAEWDPDDFRLFCGDLGNEVNDESLSRAFQKYPSFQKAKVVRDKRTGKTKGYGFVSFKDSQDFIKAMREMDGKYVGNRPIKLRKSNWKDRNLESVRKKEIEKQKMGLK